MFYPCVCFSSNSYSSRKNNTYYCTLPGKEGKDLNIYVVFDSEQITFCVEREKIESTYFPKQKVFYSISFQTPKETGRDLLRSIEFANEECLRYRLTPKEFECGGSSEWQNLIRQVDFSKWKSLYLYNRDNNFPIDKNSGAKDFLFLEILLCFITELENSNGVFVNNSYVREVRGKLRLSFVYQLIVAKLNFVFCMKQGYEGGLETNYYRVVFNDKAKKYIDLLNVRELMEYIPKEYFNRRGSLFGDPVNETDFVTRVGNRRKELLLPNLRSTGQRFFFIHHDIFKVCTSSASKWLFNVILFLMVIWMFLMWKDYPSCAFAGEVKFILPVIIILLFVVLCRRVSNFHLFLPRILIAILVAWISIGLCLDFLRGLIVLQMDWFYYVIVSFCVVVTALLVMVQIRAKSPWDSLFRMGMKSIYITIISAFFSLTIGFYMHLAFGEGLFVNNNTLQDNTYCGFVENVKMYEKKLYLLHRSLDAYRDNVFASQILKKSSIDTHFIEQQRVLINFQIIRDVRLWHGVDCRNPIGLLDTNDLKSIEACRNDVEAELGKVANFINDLTSDSLMKYSTRDVYMPLKQDKYSSVCVAYFNSDKVRKEIATGISFWGGSPKRWFPSLLFIQAVLVLLFSFVAHLFISNNTVTEPL